MVELKDFLSRKVGFWIMVVGAFLFLATPLFLYLWSVDTDVWGVMVFIVGFLFAIIRWKHK